MSDTFGDRLKYFRKTCRFTQQSISETLGIDRTTYSCYERNVTVPNAKICATIAKLYGITLEELMGTERRFSSFGDQDPGSPDPADRDGENYPDISSLLSLSKEERHLICLFRAAREDQQESLLRAAADCLKKNDP